MQPEGMHGRHYINVKRDKFFTSKIDLMLHNTIYERQKPNRCVFCNTKFPDTRVLLRNMTDHEDSFICGICSRQYIDTSSLIRHLHAHISSFSRHCKLCKKQFKTEAEEKFHIYVTPYSRPHL